MNKTFEMTQAELNTILGKEGRVKLEALNEEMGSLGRQIAMDQEEWVDRCMKDLLPPHLYDCARRLENLEELAAYVDKNKIRIIYMPDTLRMRIEVRGKTYGEWKANLLVDGEPVDFTPSLNNGVDSSSFGE